MTQNKLHDQDYQIPFKATRMLAVEGEPHYTTDGHRLYMFDGTVNRRVHGLDMILTFDGEVMVNDGEVMWFGEY
jgi:hypothetical protein